MTEDRRSERRDETPLVPLLAGSLLLLFASRRRGAERALAALGGAGLLAHALTPSARRTFLRTAASRRRADVRRAVVVPRPVREAFAYCSNFENFPQLVDMLDSVTDFGDGRSHWVLRRPDGTIAEWDAIVTKFVPGQVLAWESTSGGPIRSTGLVRFTPIDAGSTRLDVELSYEEPVTSMAAALRAFRIPPASRAIGRALQRASIGLAAWDPTAEPPLPEPMLPRRDGEAEAPGPEGADIA